MNAAPMWKKFLRVDIVLLILACLLPLVDQRWHLDMVDPLSLIHI